MPTAENHDIDAELGAAYRSSFTEMNEAMNALLAAKERKIRSERDFETAHNRYTNARQAWSEAHADLRVFRETGKAPS